MNTIHPSSVSLKKADLKTPLTFGEFVAGVYHAWGRRKAEGVIRLAIKSHLIEFRGQKLFVIS